MTDDEARKHMLEWVIDLLGRTWTEGHQRPEDGPLDLCEREFEPLPEADTRKVYAALKGLVDDLAEERDEIGREP